MASSEKKTPAGFKLGVSHSATSSLIHDVPLGKTYRVRMDVYGDNFRERAEAIVTAVNNYYALIKTLKPFARIADMETRASPSESVMVNVARCRDARELLNEIESAS